MYAPASQAYVERVFSVCGHLTSGTSVFRTIIKTLFSQTVKVNARIWTNSRCAKIVKGTSNSSLYLKLLMKLFLCDGRGKKKGTSRQF